MGHKNYSKFSQSFKKPENEEVISVMEDQISIEEVLTEEEVANLNEEDIATVDVNGNLTGIVSGCEKLNLRKEASKDSGVLTILNTDTELVVSLEESTDEFYKVVTESGVEGYCMKKFITIK